MPERKLTFTQAQEIRSKRKAGVPQRKLAKEYGVSQTTISAIEHNRMHNSPEPTNRVKQPPRVIKGVSIADMRKLTDDQVRAIREKLRLKKPVKQIAREYGVAPNTIVGIRDRITYKHVK